MPGPGQADLLSDPLLAPASEVEGYKVLGGVVIYQKLGAGRDGRRRTVDTAAPCE